MLSLLIIQICFNIEIDQSFHSFLLFIALFEKNKKISDLFKSKILNEEDKSKISKRNFDPYYDLHEAILIATDALSYAISKRSIDSIKYILEICRERFIIPEIKDTSIIELFGFENKDELCKILRKILDYEVIISYENSGAKQVEEHATEVKKKSVSSSSQKSKYSDKIPFALRSREESKVDQRIGEREEYTSSNSHINGAFEYNEVHPKRFTSRGEVLQKEHIFEILFWSKVLEEDQEINLMKILFGDFKYYKFHFIENLKKIFLKNTICLIS